MGRRITYALLGNPSDHMETDMMVEAGKNTDGDPGGSMGFAGSAELLQFFDNRREWTASATSGLGGLQDGSVISMTQGVPTEYDSVGMVKPQIMYDIIEDVKKESEIIAGDTREGQAECNGVEDKSSVYPFEGMPSLHFNGLDCEPQGGFVKTDDAHPLEGDNDVSLSRDEIEELLSDVPLMKSGMSWRMYPMNKIPPRLKQMVKHVNQRITGEETALLVDDLFEHMWEFPNVEIVRDRKVTRGDHFNGDVRIDFVWKQGERTLCRVCGRHVLKQKFATEHYQKNMSCWRMVMSRLGIPVMDGPPANSSRLIQSSGGMGPSILWPNRTNGASSTLENRVQSLCSTLYSNAVQQVDKELRQWRSQKAWNQVECPDENLRDQKLDALTIDSSVRFPFLRLGSGEEEPYFEVVDVNPSVAPANRPNEYNFCFIRLRFNRTGGRVIHDLFCLECEFLVDWGDGTLMQARKYTLWEAGDTPEADPKLRNLYKQGFAYLKTYVPQKPPCRACLRVRIPKTLWQYWDATTNESMDVHFDFLNVEPFVEMFQQPAVCAPTVIAASASLSSFEAPSPNPPIANSLHPSSLSSVGVTKRCSWSYRRGPSCRPHPYSPSISAHNSPITTDGGSRSASPCATFESREALDVPKSSVTVPCQQAMAISGVELPSDDLSASSGSVGLLNIPIPMHYEMPRMADNQVETGVLPMHHRMASESRVPVYTMGEPNFSGLHVQSAGMLMGMGMDLDSSKNVPHGVVPYNAGRMRNQLKPRDDVAIGVFGDRCDTQDLIDDARQTYDLNEQKSFASVF